MKNLVMDITGSAVTESFYQKTATSLIPAGINNNIKGIPRGADFPFIERGVTLKNAVILQHGGEGIIYWKDILTSNIRQEVEVISDVTDAVVYSTDNVIYATLSENDSPSTINTVAITAGYEWDSATIANRDPVFDIARAIEAIQTDRYPIMASGRGFIAMNEATFTYLITNTKVLNHPTFKLNSDTVNGIAAELLKCKIYVTPVVTNDKVLVGIAKTCGNWISTCPLTVDIIIDPQKKYTIRASEIGVCQLTDPESLCLLTNVRA
jgi:hypothetical protein